MKSTDTIKGLHFSYKPKWSSLWRVFRQFNPSKTVSTSSWQLRRSFNKRRMYASLKSFSKGKTPGTDGLTAEFYLSFWELLGQELVDSFNYAFEKGEMLISQKRDIITLIPRKTKTGLFWIIRGLSRFWTQTIKFPLSQSQLELRKCYPAKNYW